METDLFSNTESSASLQLHPNVKRRFPKAVRIGVHGLKELHQQYRRHWISPISKLEELFHNLFIREQRLKDKIERRLLLLEVPSFENGFTGSAL